MKTKLTYEFEDGEQEAFSAITHASEMFESLYQLKYMIRNRLKHYEIGTDEARFLESLYEVVNDSGLNL